MKKIISILALLLTALMLLSFFTACDGEGETTEAVDTTEAVETEAPAPATIKFTEGGKALYSIVRPDESDTAYDIAKSFAKDIQNATGLSLEQETDFKSWNTVRDPEAYEILLGFTNYDETAEVMKDLRYYDYAIVIRGHKIVITAYTDSSLKKAITYFRNNMLPLIVKGEDGEYTMNLFEDYIYRGAYNVDSVTLDGNPLQNYTVVYGKGTPAGEEAAQAVVNVLASATGIYLPIKNDSEAETDCEILVGKTFPGRSEYERRLADRSEYVLQGIPSVGQARY